MIRTHGPEPSWSPHDHIPGLIVIWLGGFLLYSPLATWLHHHGVHWFCM